MRLVLWKEAWQGLAESCAKDSCVPNDVNSPDESSVDLSTQPRASAANFEGRWKAYDVSAVPIDEEDPLTGNLLTLTKESCAHSCLQGELADWLCVGRGCPERRSIKSCLSTNEYRAVAIAMESLNNSRHVLTSQAPSNRKRMSVYPLPIFISSNDMQERRRR